ncbi:SPOR domain-containing protein [Rhodobacteraceae bacterium W635]|nr:SPOR domain-containing protein [Rhodobacteraceae bacterium W635]
MFLLRTVSGLALGMCLALPALSQTVAELGGPAELPPGDFRGEQYVDSRGCVFIRAGYGGQETWVARVNRDRQPLCGYEPTLGTGGGDTEVAAAPEPRPSPSPEPTREPDGNRVEVVIDRPGPASRPAPSTPNAPRPTVSTAAASPSPSPDARPAPQPERRVASCQGLPAGAAQYMQGHDVRCGPQANHPSPGAQIRPAAAAAAAGHRELQLTPVVIPEGYRPAWDDGRLNAARGLPNATPQGDAQMARYWTETVPRSTAEIDPAADGVPAGHSAGGEVVTRSSSTPDLDPAPAPEPEAPRVQVPQGHRYVEVARYSERGNADAARAQLQRQGVATQLGGVARGGAYDSYVVLAGPFADPQALARTLVRARGLGYSGAVTR